MIIIAKSKKGEFTPTRFALPTSKYNADKAEYGIAFIESLKHTKGEWYNKPFLIITLAKGNNKECLWCCKGKWLSTVYNSLCGNSKKAR